MWKKLASSLPQHHPKSGTTEYILFSWCVIAMKLDFIKKNISQIAIFTDVWCPSRLIQSAYPGQFPRNSYCINLIRYDLYAFERHF